MKHAVILVALGIFGMTACSSEIELPTATPELLVGTWEVDFESTWNKSRDAFMADTMRGADAYPDDVKEKATIVKGEMEKLFGGGIYTFGAKGTASMTMGGESKEGTYKVNSQEGNKLDINLEGLLRAKAYEVEFLAQDTAVLVLKGTKPMRIILNRKGGEMRAVANQLTSDEVDQMWFDKQQKQADSAKEKKDAELEQFRALEERAKADIEAMERRILSEEQKEQMFDLALELERYVHEKKKYPDSLSDPDLPARLTDSIKKVEYFGKGILASGLSTRVVAAAERDAEGNRLVIFSNHEVDSMTEEEFSKAIEARGN